MDKQKFLRDSDFALHWYLPLEEADEVFADYQEMVVCAEADFPLLQEEPKEIARSLSNRREHRRWLLFMSLLLLSPLAASLFLLYQLLCSVFGFAIEDFLWTFLGGTAELLFIPSLLLPLGSLFFAKRLGQKPPRPRPALWLGLFYPALILLLGWLSVHWLFAACHGVIIFAPQSLLIILCVCGLASVAVCAYSLLQCRLRSCRWLTVYGMALTLIIGVIMIISILTNMSFTGEVSLSRQLIWNLLYIGEIMWAGTALSLANWF